MKKTILFLLIAVLSQTIMHAQQQPQREVRAVWLSTMWALDFPKTLGAANQKDELIRIFDDLQAHNFNTICFQVRTLSDAFYKSKFQEEAWSQWLTGTRGNNPDWDPLEFAVEEAHKRGMELHAWINPYRYSSGTSTHGNLSTDYPRTQPGWMIDYGSNIKILNPGVPEVRERIVDIVEDIITKYNVDGILFDDYFYRNGATTDAMDQEQFDAYRNGFPDTDAGRADWRRENINMMIADVQARIKSIKPWLAFGVGPAGVASSNASVAAGHGVRPSPASDWQYNGIYSDPVMWLRRGTIDYISPQIYWDSQHATNKYDQIAAWWAEVSNQFGRHFFASNTSHLGGDTDRAEFSTTEVLNQISWLRQYDRNGTPGAIHFRYLTYIPPLNSTNKFTALKNSPYQLPALTAVYGWKPAPIQTLVENLNVATRNVTWNYTDNNVRYVIYAIPNANRNDADAFTSPKYLQGVSYTRSFTLPATISTTTHKIAVAVYDRYGNLFPARVFGEDLTTLASVQLTFPAQNQMNVAVPLTFTWVSNGADYYVLEIAEDIDFTKPIISRETTTASFATLNRITNLKANTPYYWRVRAIKVNAPVSISEVRTFNNSNPILPPTIEILTPANGATDVSLTPEFTWKSNIINAAVTIYTLEISDKTDFSNLIYSENNAKSPTVVPSGILEYATTYYARVKGVNAGNQITSEQINFTTEDEPVSVPKLDISAFCYIYYPAEGIARLVINQMESTSAAIEIYSLTGGLFDRQVHGLNAGTNTITLDMTEYAKGIYLAKIHVGNNAKTLKVYR